MDKSSLFLIYEKLRFKNFSKQGYVIIVGFQIDEMTFSFSYDSIHVFGEL